MAGISNVVIKIGAQTAEAVAAIRQVDGSLKDTQTTGQKFQGALTKAAVPAAAALTALSAAAITSAKAAASAQASREQLDSQLKRSVGATDAAVAANEDWVSSMSRMAAVSAGEIRPALAGLVRATGDVTAAHKLMRDALDLSAATGKPVATIAAALQKAYNGQTSSLKRLVPSLSDAALKSGDWSKIQAQLNQQVGGAAAEEAQTAEGQYRSLQLAIKGLQVAIGTALLPALQDLLPIMTNVARLAGEHSQVFVAVGAAVGVVAGSILALNAALKIYRAVQVAARAATVVFTAAQWLLNVALNANPIGLVVIGLAALAAGLYLAYRHSATFRAVVQGAFSAAKDAVHSLLAPTMQIVAAFGELYSRSAGARTAVVGAFHAILGAINEVVAAVGALIGKIASIHFPHVPHIPGLNATTTQLVPFGAARAGAAPGPVYNINVTGAVDPESTAIAIRRSLERYDRRRGGRPLGGLGAPA